MTHIEQYYNEISQAASLCNYINNSLSHYPSQPELMSEDLYNLALEGASTSNIAMATYNLTIPDTIKMYLDDGDSGNISRVGHRRWILYPQLSGIGFGQVGGYSATVLIYEECRLLKKNMVDSVFSPMSHPRQAKFMTREKYAGDKRWQEETISIYITSARMKSEWFWTTFKEVVQKCYNSKRIVENFFAADIYTAIEYGLKTKADFEKSKSQMSELDFRMEILNEMIGEAENAFFTLEMFRNNQVLTVPFVPPNVRDILGGEDDYIKEIIKLHSNISMGDVEVQWGGTLSSLFNADRWILNIRFYKPIDYNFSIVFSLKNHYSIIDAIFQSKGLRIAYGHKGEKVSQVSDHIIIEIPDTGISPKWEKTLSRIIKNKMRRLKIPRKELGKATQEQINKMREILNIRFKHNPD